MSPAVEAFPWRSLERVARRDVAALRDARAWAEQHLRLDAFGRALAELTEADVRVVLQRAGAHGVRPPAGGDVGVAFAGARIEMEPALAATLVARAIRRPPPAFVVSGLRPQPALAGAVAAVIAAAARRAHAGAGLRVAAAGEAGAIGAELPDGVAIAVTVVVADEAFAARVVVPRAPAGDGWSARRLAALGALPLAIPIVACATAARAEDAASLRAGDVWLPGTWPMELGPAREAEGTVLRGPVLLAAPSAVSGARAQLVEGGRLVLSGETDAMVGEEETMTRPEGAGVLEAVGDVPVVVRVEIGVARMAARDWAALGKGDVVTLGRRVGELVLLRVGGVPVARGELVIVDGEVGVRIAERLGTDVATP
jgi:flagellar motor switch protein FliN/FliY